MYMFALLSPYVQTFAASVSSCSHKFLGLTPWYGYFPDAWFNTNCTINTKFTFLPADGHSGLLLIGLAIVDDLIRIAALVAVGFVIYGGLQYITSQGSPDTTKKAQETIINALVGLVVAIIAAGIVGFIGSKLGS